MTPAAAEFHPIKHLAPGWFAVVMGTGGLANILDNWGAAFAPFRPLAVCLAALAAAVYILLVGPWLARWLCYFGYVRRDLHHPVTVNFFVTAGVGTAIVGTNVSTIWSRWLPPDTAYALMLGLWIAACFIVTAFTFYTGFRLFSAEEAPDPAMMNFSWIMAPIANMSMLLLGNPLLALTAARQAGGATLIFTLNAVFLGIGFFLFIFLSAVVFVRLTQSALPPPAAAPTFGIFLSAAGLEVNALIDMGLNAETLGFFHAVPLMYFAALVIWGFGFWIVGIIAIVCLYQARRSGIPFSLAWWAFIFPLAAYTIASQKIAAWYGGPLTVGWAIFLTGLLALLWLATLAQTLRGVLNGALFTGPPLS
ncbi:MAG: C4-dicarboxylate ABC transporter [Gracilibacteraceae bacterium]|jgi:C4-dicarboxylate transporter/malic acid transport protein|nr:C4-dicarboxylate ABC transporter [Gracilibacteraceae bacterium]